MDLARKHTAHMRWIPNPGPQTLAYDCEADQMLYGGEAGGGKLQPVDSKVLTPHGWKAIGDLKVGSKVCASDGTVSTVIGVFPQGVVDIYRVTMRDGGTCEAGLDHNWLAWPTHANVKIGNVETCGSAAARKYTTRQLLEEMQRPARDNGRLRRFVVPLPEPVSFNVAGGCVGTGNFVGRPIDPYFLGLLIGDGCVASQAPNITSMDDEIAKYLAALAEADLRVSSRDGNRALQFNFRGEFRKKLVADLENVGLQGKRTGSKAIPRNYLFAPVADRLALLQGLMDTDGWVEDKRACYFTTISPQLADDFEHLVRSLGGVTSRSIKHPTYTYADKKKQGQDAYTIRVKLKNPADAFRLTRKKDIAANLEHQCEGRIIESIEFSRKSEAVCIAVSHPNSLYITDDFIVTHNTDLLLGLASQEHQRSLLLRRINKDVSWLVDRMSQIIETRNGYNGQDDRWTLPDGRVIDFSGCQHPGDEQRNKGRPKDFIGFDEASDFLESQVEFIIGWLRTTIKGQRCRIVFATNPPTSVEGEWIVRWFAPWVDPQHPLYPYPMGKLLWTCRGPDDQWLWFEEPGEQEVNGQSKPTISRTFIRSGLGDNPDLANSGYRSQLEQMPEELRKRYLKGDFTAGAKDDEFQVIPTDWIRAAQDRWIEDDGERMEAVGIDVAQGGDDCTVMAPRWKGKGKVRHWVDKLRKWKGKETPDGAAVAGLFITLQRHAAQANIDMGGGYGGSTYEKLNEAEVSCYGFVPSESSSARTSDGRLSFKNKRAEATWRLRELLNPESEELVALPPDAQLRADLASYRWKLQSGGVIQVESKDDIRKRIGRSPDDGDAVIIAMATGAKRMIPRRNDAAAWNRQTHATGSRLGDMRRSVRR